MNCDSRAEFLYCARFNHETGITMSLQKLVLTGVLLCLPFATTAASEWTQTLKRINETGEMNPGFRQDQAPISFDRGDGQAVGYSVDLCKYVASMVVETLGKTTIKVNFVPVTAATRFEAIQSGKIDILCGVTTRTLSRAALVGFTQPTFVTGGSLLALKGSTINQISDLAGKRVAVVDNTTTIETLEKALAQLEAKAEVIPVTSTSQGMNLLDSGEVDALAADQVVLIGQVVARDGGERYVLSNQLYWFETLALAIPRGDVDFQLVADRALSRLYRSGEIIEVFNAWFGIFGEEPPDMLKALYQLNATQP
jgi:ABC-type amino acid transport substrate-binding protein